MKDELKKSKRLTVTAYKRGGIRRQLRTVHERLNEQEKCAWGLVVIAILLTFVVIFK